MHRLNDRLDRLEQVNTPTLQGHFVIMNSGQSEEDAIKAYEMEAGKIPEGAPVTIIAASFVSKI